MLENTKIRTLCAGKSDKRVSREDVATINSLTSV